MLTVDILMDRHYKYNVHVQYTNTTVTSTVLLVEYGHVDHCWRCVVFWIFWVKHIEVLWYGIRCVIVMNRWERYTHLLGNFLSLLHRL